MGQSSGTLDSVLPPHDPQKTDNQGPQTRSPPAPLSPGALVEAGVSGEAAGSPPACQSSSTCQRHVPESCSAGRIHSVLPVRDTCMRAAAQGESTHYYPSETPV
ncbi:hypothetical protein EOD39_5463 [Acipenser ruthenus]|uniref:Uncharacterized protein n=1 Tax=Acipenser ruthenus TaxID=7906 RepID=A0A662YYJ3_ACIRT|nr:hypothetical protein EOD39_5463 [Acipenser ruthenus]